MKATLIFRQKLSFELMKTYTFYFSHCNVVLTVQAMSKLDAYGQLMLGPMAPHYWGAELLGVRSSLSTRL